MNSKIDNIAFKKGYKNLDQYIDTHKKITKAKFYEKISYFQ